MDLVLSPALEPLARAMECGAKKYGAWNWRATPVRYSVYLAAMLRHLLAAAARQDADHESGLDPLAHVMASCLIVLDARAHGTLIDDRPQQKETS
jgi:hypothetical protein